MSYKLPCGCTITDQDYDQVQKGRSTVEHGFSVSSWPTVECPNCKKISNNMWSIHIYEG